MPKIIETQVPSARVEIRLDMAREAYEEFKRNQIFPLIEEFFGMSRDGLTPPEDFEGIEGNGLKIDVAVTELFGRIQDALRHHEMGLAEEMDAARKRDEEDDRMWREKTRVAGKAHMEEESESFSD